MPVSVGDKLGPYEILASIGAGGMGEVYRAVDTRLGREVALKILPEQMAADKDRLARFHREARAAAALNHPNIVTLYSVEECGGIHFLTMELVEGRPLHELIPAEGFPATRVVELATALAEAIAAAHEKGLVHRDLKPANIMITGDGRLKVLDFGLAKAIRTAGPDDKTLAALSETQAGIVMGTPQYMSPEQISGSPVDHRTDIFSLGIILHEMLTGSRPFEGKTQLELAASILRDTPPPITKADAPTDLVKLIEKCLAKGAGERTQSARLLVSGLQAIRSRSASAPDRAPARGDDAFWVAVAAFRSTGANPELATLGEGLTEEIVAGLSRFSYLRVLTQGTAGARYVLEGSLRQAGTQVRVAVQLKETSSGATLWAEPFTRPYSADSIFEIQDDLVPTIVSTIGETNGVLTHSMWTSLRDRDPLTLTPYEAMLRCFGALEQLSAEELQLAHTYLKRVIEQEPNHALCLAMLSVTCSQLYGLGFDAPDSQPLDAALVYARRAVSAEPSNHQAHHALALAHFFRREPIAFEAAMERALALNRMDGYTLASLGMRVAYMGDWDRGCEHVARAMKLNPRHPGWYWFPFLCRAYRRSDFKTALGFALRVNLPNLAWTPAGLAAIHGQLGNRVEAAKAMKELLALKPNFTPADFQKYFYEPEMMELWVDGLRKAGLPDAQPGSRTVEDSGAQIPTPVAKAATVIVLPFANTSPDPADEYFSDGLTEEVISGLASVGALRVISRNSSMSLKQRRLDTAGLVKQLAVTHIVSGSVRKAGNSLRVAAELVDARDDTTLWSDKFSGALEDVFRIQEEIAAKIVAALRGRLGGIGPAPVGARPIADAAVYDCYLRARHEMYSFEPAAQDRAMRLVDQATEIAGDNALLLALRGQILWQRVNGMFDSDEGNLDEAAECARRALLLDPENANALFLRGIVAGLRGATAAALRDLDRACRLRPSDPNFLVEFCRFSNSAGVEHRARMEELIQIDPLAPIAYGVAAFYYAAVGETHQGAAAARRVLDLTPGAPSTLHIIAAAYLAKAGEREEAKRILAAAGRGLAGTIHGSWAMFLHFALAGDAARACAEVTPQLEHGVAMNEHFAHIFADGYAAIGRNAEALRWLRVAMNRGFINYPDLVAHDPLLEQLRGDAGFRDLLATVKTRWKALGPALPKEVTLLPEPPAASSPSTESKVVSGPSLAVLPFTNMSGDREQEYFSDGLTEEIINTLSKIPGLRVIARTSAFAFKGQSIDVRAIAGKLGVAHVLEGGVRKAGNRIRVTAQLIAAADGSQVWSERYDRDMEDVFAVQDATATAIAGALHLKLAAGPRAYTPALPAYEEFLKARHHLQKWTPESAAAAQQCLRRAMALDPGFAAAHTELCWTFHTLAVESRMRPAEAAALMEAEARAALYIDASLGDAHAALAMAAVLDFDWDRAGQEFGLALAREPVNTYVRVLHGLWYLAPLGRMKEAREQLERALKEDPLNLLVRVHWGGVLTGRLGEGEAMENEILKLDPNYWIAYIWRGGWRALKGRLAEARADAERVCALAPWNAGGTGMLAGILSLSGEEAEAGKLMGRLGDGAAPGAPLGFIYWHTLRGEIDSAADWYEKLIEQKDLRAPWLVAALFADRLMSSQHWPRLRRMMNLPEVS